MAIQTGKSFHSANYTNAFRAMFSIWIAPEVEHDVSEFHGPSIVTKLSDECE